MPQTVATIRIKAGNPEQPIAARPILAQGFKRKRLIWGGGPFWRNDCGTVPGHAAPFMERRYWMGA